MDPQLIKALIDALQASGLDELEYSREGETLRLSKGGQPTRSAPPPVLAVRAPHPSANTMPAPAPVPATSTDTVDAPLYGVVHLQRAPGAPAFVAPGQAVEAGQVVCTIEAMKVFTDIRAERAGTVEAVLVADGQEVEPGQPLVRLA